MTSVTEFNNLDGKTVLRETLMKLSKQAFNEQQLDVHKRISKLLADYPDAKSFDLSVDKRAKTITPEALGIPYMSAAEVAEIAGNETAALGKAITSNDIYDMVTNQIISSIEQSGDLIWYSGRDKAGVKDKPIFIPLPINFNNKKYYRGINRLILSMYPTKKMIGDKLLKHTKIITDDRLFWMTINQIEQAKGKLKKGSIAMTAVYYNWVYKNGDKSITETEYKKLHKKYCGKQNKNKEACAELSKFPFLRYYNVFNERDIEGIDFEAARKELMAKAKKYESEVEKIEAAEAIIQSMPNRPKMFETYIGKGESPHYVPSTDTVVMPQKEQYSNVAIWYGTAFHELVHSTGHASRLHRAWIADIDPSDLEARSFEELIAELGSAFLNSESGIFFHTLKKNTAYIKGWKKTVVETLKEDNKAIFKAAGAAQKAADYILDRDAAGMPAYLKGKEKKEDKKTDPLDGITEAEFIKLVNIPVLYDHYENEIVTRKNKDFAIAIYKIKANHFLAFAEDGAVVNAMAKGDKKEFIHKNQRVYVIMDELANTIDKLKSNDFEVMVFDVADIVKIGKLTAKDKVIGYGLLDNISGEIVATKKTIPELEKVYHDLKVSKGFESQKPIVHEIILKNKKNTLGVKVEVDWTRIVDKEDKKPALDKYSVAKFASDLPDEKTIEESYRGLSFLSDKRAKSEIQGYSEGMYQTYLHYLEKAKKTGAVDKFHETFDRLYPRLLKRKLAVIQKRGGLLSVMITGPSGYPKRSQGKKHGYYDQALGEYYKYTEYFEDKLRAAIYARDAIVGGESDTLEKLEDKLEKLKRNHEIMKAANVAAREYNKTKDVSVFEKYGIGPKLAKAIMELKPGEKAVKTFQLTNSNAEIKRIESRIKEEEARAKHYTDGNKTTQYSAFEVVENVDDNRLQIIFDGKPDEAVRTILKKNGYRWSPKKTAWQRQLTKAALSNFRSWLLPQLAKHLDTGLKKKAKPKLTTEELEKINPEPVAVKPKSVAVNTAIADVLMLDKYNHSGNSPLKAQLVYNLFKNANLEDNELFADNPGDYVLGVLKKDGPFHTTWHDEEIELTNLGREFVASVNNRLESLRNQKHNYALFDGLAGSFLTPENPIVNDVLKWAEKNLYGQYIYHPDIGKKIHFRKSGIKKAIYGKKGISKIRLQLVYIAKQLLQSSRLINIESDKKNRRNVVNIYKLNSFHFINEQGYKIFITIRETPNGVLYYEHEGIKIKKHVRQTGQASKDEAMSSPLSTSNVFSDNKNTKKTNNKKLGVVFVGPTTPTPIALPDVNNMATPIEPTENNETIKPIRKIDRPINKYVQNVKETKAIAHNATYFDLQGPFIDFTGALEKKTTDSLVITLDAPPGAGKTRSVFQFLNIAANSGKPSIFASLEEHPTSKLFHDKRAMYITPENEDYIDTIGELPPTYHEFLKLIEPYEIIAIDSWNKVFETYKGIDFDRDLRKALNGKIIIAIFQRTGTGQMRGGSKAGFDGDIILEIVKADDYRDSYVIARKNRYQDTPLNEIGYNFYIQKVINPELQSSANSIPTEITV
ncbi:zincin-like metallopeptidase domain-containing protein [Gelidibacter japonicus]|uniref:zincin-like metallopeptidase domain-containing protein n=1 Tax=Gelidibacter japonicus TaxID=1962232 RepID=UPI002AFE764C|nr:zincin-like metallopeptidase domain-containing protein [Gelidibacter japonicus]